MGVTLPLLVDTLTEEKEGAQVTAQLYGFNTLGAVLGVLLTGFVLIANLGETGTVGFGVVLNFLLGAAAWTLSSGPGAAPETTREATRLARGALLIACLCGFVSIALEVVWTRLLILLVGSSVYAFSLMLASFLVGTALGSLRAAPSPPPRAASGAPSPSETSAT